ncbi:MAG: hypothetical protein ACF8MJ_03680 [Phycisphaerales bacterium JB050]
MPINLNTTLVAIAAAFAGTGIAYADMPQMGGPMKHIMVSLDGDMLMAHVDPSVPTPVLMDYGHEYDGDASVLNGTMYNAQYGWMVEGFWAPPSGSSIWIEQTSATPGLLAYSGGTMMDQGSFDPIFGTDGSSPRIEWDGTMLHNWYAVTAPGEYLASYAVYFGDDLGNPIPGFEPAQVTLQWNAVPTPASAALLGLAGCIGIRRRR